MQLRKILDSDLTGKGVVGQSDTPGLSALEMQQKVEEISRAVIIPIFNENVDTLEQNAGTTDGSLAQKADKTYVDAQDDAINTAMAGQKAELQQEIASGDSTTLQSAQEYTDTRETAVKQYVDTQDGATLQSAKTYAQTQDATTLQSAKTYADETGAAGKAYADQKSAQALDNAKSYADEQDGVTLASAKSYTDTRESAIKKYVGQQDAATLESAKSYADNQDQNTLESAKEYVDGQLNQKANVNDVYTKPQVDEAISLKANTSDVLLKGNTTPFTPTEDYQPATKAYADSIAAQAGAVTSVFGRAGAVAAQKGDYTAEMVGARSDTWMPTASEVGARSDTWMPTASEVGAATPQQVQQVQEALDTHTANSDIHVTAQEKTAWSQKADKSTKATYTLAAESWAGDASPFTYTLNATGVTATSNQEILPDLNITAEQLEALQAANIQDGGQALGSVTLKAFGDKPAMDIPIRVIVRGDA